VSPTAGHKSGDAEPWLGFLAASRVFGNLLGVGTMAAPEQRRGLVIAVSVTGTIVTIGLSALGWGGFARLVAHPARAAFVGLIVALTAVALFSPVNFSSGEREDVANRLMFVPSAVGMLVLAWVMPHMDRRDAWTIDGDATRWLGIAALAVGGVLRIWPMFVLGRRFSGLVAIQPGHELATGGPYRWVRHPSYLGMMLGFFGWALVFRSAVGVVAAVLGFPLLADRIDAEERLLAGRFGAAYDEYRRRTWRLVPGIY
jgi:protein-S-isoprenylcysteine O-methyltransferase Ste14